MNSVDSMAKAIRQFRISLPAICFFLMLVQFPQTSFGQVQSPIDIRINVADTTGHYYEVNLSTEAEGASVVKFRMPVWTPGSYLVREFEQHVFDFSAHDESGASLAWSKENKNTWAVAGDGAKTVKIRYRVYAFDLSIRFSFLDADRAFINPSSVCMFVVGSKDSQYRVELSYPQNWTSISTGLPRPDPSEPIFVAEDYDQLVDCPIEIGTQQVIPFEVDDIPYELAVTGSGNVSPDTLVPYFEQIISATTEIMGAVPFDRYVFLMRVGERGGGGLEHRNSCVLGVNRWSFQPASRFRGFLGLVSHEFFHAWNVKAIHPEPLGPFNYSEENHSTMLWIAEGFTSYYGRRILLKAGLTSKPSYVSSIRSSIQSLERTPGRKWQSLSEASFDAWIKAYRTNENSYNTTISYYSKGALVGLALDLLIRHETKNKRSLDDVMRLLYKRYVEDQPRAYAYQEFIQICEEVSKQNLSDFFAGYVDGTTEIDFKKYLGYAGYELRPDTTQESGPPNLGMRWRSSGGNLIVTRVVANSPAYHSGLNVNDELIAINQFRLNESSFNRVREMMKESDSVTLTVNRGGMIRKLPLKLKEWHLPRYWLSKKEEPNSLEKSIAKSWLFEEE
ncbi:MAG: PDZ domain-containing protein [bacterium]